jgi:hypothetical protein
VVLSAARRVKARGRRGRVAPAAGKWCRPELVHHHEGNCVALTDELLGQVVEQIVAWYDAVEAVLIA